MPSTFPLALSALERISLGVISPDTVFVENTIPDSKKASKTVNLKLET
jgi:hypothetical protein